MSKLEDTKLKKIFINNFFKTKYFKELNLERYQVKRYDYHQLCFIYKFSPEAMIYSVHKFANMSKFNNNNVKKFFEVRYKEILKQPFHDEQLYYYYAIKIFGFDDLLSVVNDLVINSNNQILISYYLKDGLFTDNQINLLKGMNDEKYWFQNYNLILYNDQLYQDLNRSINKFLIPKNATKNSQKNTYKEFYRNNLSNKNEIIRDIHDVNNEIDYYLDLKIQESESKFQEMMQGELG